MALRSTPAARCPAPGEASPRPDPRPPAPSLATRNSPPFRLVQAHLVLGLLGMVLFAAGLVWKADALRGHFFQPALLALVHLCVLGWLMPIAIGALHQLVPVVFDVPARGGALVWTALVLYGVGALGLVGHMATYATGTGLVMSAAMLLGGIALYALNLVATLARAKNVTLTGVYVIAALLYLVAGASLGFALAWNLWHPYLMVDHAMWLKAHAHVAAGGFFGLLVMGVAYRLLEMFLVSHGASMRAGWVALVAVNLCLSLLAVNFIFGRRPELTFAACAAGTIGIAAFLVQVRAIFVRRVRRRTDPAWQHTFASMSYLSLALVAGVGVASVALPGVLRERVELVYGLLIFPGFIGSVVVGQLYKIVPFLVWFHRFSAYVGLKAVPAASELLPEEPQRLQCALMHAGIAILALGMLADVSAFRFAGAGAFAASAALFARNMAVVLRSRP